MECKEKCFALTGYVRTGIEITTTKLILSDFLCTVVKTKRNHEIKHDGVFIEKVHLDDLNVYLDTLDT